jgi:hypothetical protein
VRANITKRLRHGSLMAEVKVKVAADDGAWGPYLSLDDAEKLERVDSALRRGDIKAAAKEAKIYEVLALAGE